MAGDVRERMHQTELYLPSDEKLVREQTACLERLYDFNQTRPGEMEKRTAMLKEMFAEIGEGCYIEPPFHANFGGAHVHFGKNISVVTHDLPSNVVAVGTPCKVLREVGEHDRAYYFKDHKIDWEHMEE